MQKSFDLSGYPIVNLMKDGQLKTHSIHRLTAIAFIPNPKNKRCINHVNGIKADCIITNLEWCTHSENTKHAIKNGLIKINKNKFITT